MNPKSAVLKSQKKLNVFEKKFFWKQILPAYLCGFDLQNTVRKFFLNKWFSRCGSFLVSTAGNIHNHFSQWKSITSDPFIIDIVKSGLKLRFAEEPAQNIYHNIPVTKAEKQIISDEIQKLLQKEVMYPCMREEGDSMSSIFTREKRDGSHKMTLNLKQVNKHIDYEHFKMFWIL